MSGIARPAADWYAQPRRGVGEPGESRRRRPPLWLWGASVGLQVLSAAALTNFTFFFIDDYVFLNQARADSLDLTYLRDNLYEHFSAISRLLDKLLVVLAPGSWILAHTVELAIYAAALVSFAFVARTILGNGWGAFLLTILFGQSLFVIRLMFWWTATANILPATVFMLVALGCYLRWRESGSPMLLAGSFAAYALALLDYETALLFPAYVGAITLLVLEPRLRPRAWISTLWRERWAWIGFVALDVAGLVNYYSFYYYQRGVRPSNSAVAHYLAIAFFQTFVPALVGVHYPQAPIVTVAAGVVVGAGAVVTLYLRPRGWRCLVAFVLVFLATMLPVGLNRIASHGVIIGGVLYYQQTAQLMFLVLAAFAVSPRWSGRRAPPLFRRAGSVASAWRATRFRPPSRRVLAAAGLAAFAAYGALYVTSVQALSGAQWQAKLDSTFVSNYLKSDRQVRAATGAEPVLIDLRVPRKLLPKSLWPYTTYGQFFGLFNPRVRVDEIARPLYVVGFHGWLRSVRFESLARASVDRASVSRSASAPAVRTAAAIRGGACVPAGSSRSWLRLPLARVQRIGSEPNDLAYVLEVRYRMPQRSPVAVMLLGAGRRSRPATQRWGRGPGGEYIPLGFSGPLSAVEFRLPPRACVTALTFGRVRFIHGS